MPVASGQAQGRADGLPSHLPDVFQQLQSLPGPLRELIAGGVAGGVGKTSVAPLERAKILFQTGKLRGAGLGPTLVGIYQSEGVRGLYRGNGASVLRIVPYAAVHFWCYEHYRRLLVSAELLGSTGDRVPPALDLLAGSAAGGTAVLLTYPLDLVRTRLAFMTEAGGAHRGGQPAAAAAGAAGAAGAAAGAGPSSTAAAASAAAAAIGRSSGSSSSTSVSSSSTHLPLSYGHAAGGQGMVLAASRGSSSSSGGGASSSGRGVLGGGAARLGQGAAVRGLHVQPPLPLAAAAAAHHHYTHHTIRSVLGSTLRGEGVRGLYHGVGASLYGILPYAGLKFYVYQHLKQWYHHSRPREVTRTGVDGRPRLPVPVMLSFGGLAGLVAQTATYPLDVVRRQMQVEGLKLREAAADSPTRQLAAGTQQLSLRSTPQALVLLARRHGWRCLYAGLSINYLKVVPSTAIGFTLYDSLKSALALPTNL